MFNQLNSHHCYSNFNPFNASFNEFHRFSELESRDKFLIQFITIVAAPSWIFRSVADFRYLKEKKIQVLDKKDEQASKIENSVDEIIQPNFITEMELYIQEKLKNDEQIDIENAQVEFIIKYLDGSSESSKCIVDHIDKLHIKSEDDRLKIAKRIVEHYKMIESIFGNINKFELSEENRLELARHSAGYAFGINIMTQNIDEFELSEGNRLELAKKIAVTSNGQIYLPFYIEKLNISLEEDLLEIADLIIVSHYGRQSISPNIHKFKLSEENFLRIVEFIFKEPELKVVSNFVKEFKNCEIRNDALRYEVFVRCLKFYPNSINYLSSFLPFSHLKVSDNYFSPIQNKPLNRSDIESMIKNGPYSVEMKAKLLDQLKEFNENPSSEKQDHLVFNLVSFLSLNDEQLG